MKYTDYFTYDEASGDLSWKARPLEMFPDERAFKIWNTRYAGKVAGAVARHPRRGGGSDKTQIKLAGKTLYAHRIIWEMVHGPIPDGLEIDHINGDGRDNSLKNLRLVTSVENSKNMPKPRTNTSGIVGVGWRRADKAWGATIGVGGKTKHLCYSHCLGKAIKARKAAEVKYGFHENHGRAS